MRDDHDAQSFFVDDERVARLAGEPATPAPPPPMPAPAPAAPPPMPAKPAVATPAPDVAPKPAAEPATPDGGWEVDPYRLNAFAAAVERARDRLQDVQDQVERMQDARYTPKLGTSPVGIQLEKKFADRLDAALDDQENPTSGGLRPMLAAAMKRMDDFVAGAEAAAKNYAETDQNAAADVNKTTSGPSKG